MKRHLLLAALLILALPAHASTEELIESVKQNNLPNVLKLINSGEDVNVANAQGNTALHYAVALDNADITKALLEAGANVNAVNQTGWTPLKIAEKKDVKNVVPLLKKVQEQTPQPQEIIAKIQESAALQVAAAQDVAAQAQKEAIEAKNAQLKAEQDIISLKAELAKLQKEKNEQDAKIKAENEAKIKAEQAAKAKAIASQQPKQVKPAAQAQPKVNKQPAKPAPKILPKPVVRSKSSLDNNIFAGDEEIVYCLNYLGQGENVFMLRAAGYFAASAGISETRYKQIVDLSNNFYASAAESISRERDTQCSKIITPQNTAKQNQIVRSINNSIGY